MWEGDREWMWVPETDMESTELASDNKEYTKRHFSISACVDECRVEAEGKCYLCAHWGIREECTSLLLPKEICENFCTLYLSLENVIVFFSCNAHITNKYILFIWALNFKFYRYKILTMAYRTRYLSDIAKNIFISKKIYYLTKNCDLFEKGALNCTKASKLWTSLVWVTVCRFLQVYEKFKKVSKRSALN